MEHSVAFHFKGKKKTTKIRKRKASWYELFSPKKKKKTNQPNKQTKNKAGGKEDTREREWTKRKVYLILSSLEF